MADAVLTAALDWGPVGVWAGAAATFLAALVALLSSMGHFDRFRAPVLLITFDDREPWCRSVELHGRGKVYWVRIGVENQGRTTARGCLGRLTSVASDGVSRTDVDPVQLRWAGVPRSRSFEPIDLRPGQREFLNVLFLAEGEQWTIDTFESPDFDPGFLTTLSTRQRHVLDVALFADNATTVTRSLQAHTSQAEQPTVELVR